MHKKKQSLLHLCLVLLVILWPSGCKRGEQEPEPENVYWPTENWRVALPEDVGLDPIAVLAVEQYLRQHPTEAFLLIRHGYIVHEGYYGDYSAEQLHDSYSIAKCFTSAAIGVAIQQGLIPSVQAKLTDFIAAEAAQTPNPQRYRQITIEHLLTMTSGIDFSNREHYPQMLEHDNHAAYVLQRPIAYNPGAYWKYKADPTLLSALITYVTNESMFDYLNKHLLAPIGIDHITWEADNSGQTSGNGDLHTTARNFARLGYLYLNGGVWDGKALLPADWVNLSTSPCATLERTTCNCWSEQALPIPVDAPLEYGYAWWCRKLPGVPADAYYAFGGKGQFIIVIPSLDIVSVRLADEPSRSDLVMLPEFARLVANTIKNK